MAKIQFLPVRRAGIVDKKIEYLTFPILLINGMFENPKEVIDNILCYCGYAVGKQYQEVDPIEAMTLAGKYLGITWGNAKGAYTKGKKHFKSMPAKAPMTSIKKNILWDYYDNEKSEFEIACFLAFTALRSILQAKVSCKTNKGLIHARMFGYRSVKEMPVHLESYEAKYSTRRRMDRIIQELEFTWGLRMFSSHVRGLYISFKLEYEALAATCEKQKIKYKVQELREIKKLALSNQKKQNFI